MGVMMDQGQMYYKYEVWRGNLQEVNGYKETNNLLVALWTLFKWKVDNNFCSWKYIKIRDRREYEIKD